MEIKLGHKFTALNFQHFINNYWKSTINTSSILINLEQTEWISHEGIMLLFTYINYIKESNKNIDLKIKLPEFIKTLKADIEQITFKKSIISSNKPEEIEKQITKLKKRRLKQAISLLEKWDIVNACNLDIEKNIISDTAINKYIKQYRDTYYYNYLGFNKIVQFYKINANNYYNIEGATNNLTKKIDEIYNISIEIENLLNSYTSKTPFENKSISRIITYELILNVAQHAYDDEEKIKNCFLSISLHNKYTKKKYEQYINEEYNYQPNEIQFERYVTRKIAENITSERIKESWDFFKDKNGMYKNISYIEFCFIDLGKGIIETLKESYINKKNKKYKESEVLKYAFELESSRNEFGENINIQPYIPRGLFFIIDVVKRYKGILIVRSKEKKIIFNFSNANSMVEATKDIKSEGEQYSFPGTFYNILLPEKEDFVLNAVQNKENSFKITQINKSQKFEHWVLLDWAKSIEEMYYKSNNTQIEVILFNKFFFNKIHKEFIRLNNENYNFLIYIDFVAFDNYGIEQKILYYLCNNPNINSNINVIITNFSDTKRLKDIQIFLSKTEPFLLRPIPCVYFETEKDISTGEAIGYNAIWIGIKDISDQEKLNELLKYGSDKGFELSPSALKNVEYLEGNLINITWVNKSSKAGSVKINTHIPTLNEFSFKKCLFGDDDKILGSILKDIDPSRNLSKEILLNEPQKVYYTSGNYFQKVFIRFIRILHVQEYSVKIATYLINKLLFERRELPEIDIILSVTLSSSLLSKSIKEIYNKYRGEYNNSSKPELLRLGHYYEFENETNLNLIKRGSKVLLVNDVISTGSLVNNLTRSINERGGVLCGIFSIVDCREIVDDEKIYPIERESLVVTLAEFPIKKFKNNPDKNAKIVRINPVINAPSEDNIHQSGIENILTHDPTDLLKSLNRFGSEFLKIGYLQSNHHFHYYFIDTSNLFSNVQGRQLLDNFIDNILTKENKKRDEIGVVFYPMFSGSENIGDYYLKELFHPDVKIFPLPRISTDRGWRLTLPSFILKKEAENQNVFLIDDGSNSGETLIQMIDVVSFLNVKSITVLSIVSRLEIFQRE